MFPTTVLQEASEAKEAKPAAEAKPLGPEAKEKGEEKKDREAVQLEFQWGDSTGSSCFSLSVSVCPYDPLTNFLQTQLQCVAVSTFVDHL